MIHNFSLIPPIFITSSLPSGVLYLTRAGPIGLNIAMSISKRSKYSIRMNDCRHSCHYQSFLCFEVCFVKKLAASIHVESQQLLTQLRHVPDIAFYESPKICKICKISKNRQKPQHKPVKTKILKTAVGVQHWSR